MDDAKRGVLAERVEGLLTGQHVKLYPYVRGMWPPETLFTLWKRMNDGSPSSPMFLECVGQVPTPYPTAGDLVGFVKFFDPDPPTERLMLMAQSLEHEDDVVGLLWFDDIIPGHRAALSAWSRRRFWGEPAREANRLAIRYGFEVLGVEGLWAYTPWDTAVREALAAGMSRVATLPRYVLAGDEVLDLHILRILRGDDGKFRPLV